MTDSDQWYAGREQTQIKHHLLRDYLGALANIVGQKHTSVTYVDCFSGPWKAASQDFEDTSFGIAISELKKARDHLKTHFGRTVKMRCFFIEKKRSAYEELSRFIDRKKEPGLELEARNGRFENLVPAITEFAGSSSGTFSFFFIDPRGWKSVAIDTLKPLLNIRPSEILINLMTSHLHRFVKTGNQSELFGTQASIERLRGLDGPDLDDEMVAIYSEQLSVVGGYDYVCAAVILRPDIDIPHYRLIYASRHPRGLEKFKEAEKRAMGEMEPARARAKLRKFEERTSQSGLFGATEMYGSAFYLGLRSRYLSRSRSKVFQFLAAGKPVQYDSLWKVALSNPLVFESDLKEWLRENPRLSISNLGTGKTPKIGKDQWVSLSQ